MVGLDKVPLVVAPVITAGCITPAMYYCASCLRCSRQFPLVGCEDIPPGTALGIFCHCGGALHSNMSNERRLCSIYDGALSTTSSSRSTLATDRLDDRISMSSAPTSRSVSSSSTASSADSVYPLMNEKEAFKVPLHVAADLAHRGLSLIHI